MAKNIKGRKFVATAATAALVASAIVPVASAAEFADQSKISSWAASAVAHAVDKGYMKGVDASNFNPQGTVTKAQVAQVIYNALGLKAGAPAKFSDVPAGQWFTDAVNALAEKGIASGTDKGEFEPNKDVTLSEAAVMLSKALDIKGTADLSKFADASTVPTWANEAIQALVSKGYITGGTKDGAAVLLPLDTLNRERLATMFVNVAKGELESKVATATKVASVSATNLKEIVVTFDGTVEEEAAEKITNYKLDGSTLTAVSSVTLADDKKSVVISLSNDGPTLTNQKAHKLTVSNIGKVASAEVEFTALDVSVPEVKSVEILGNKVINVTFSEPVKKDSAQTRINYKVNGFVVNGEVELSKDGKTATITLYSRLKAGTNKISVAGVQDYANMTIINYLDKEFTVADDTAAPASFSIVSATLDAAIVKFDEAVDASTVKAGDIYWTDNDGVVKHFANSAVPTDSTFTTYKITFADQKLPARETTLVIEKASDLFGNVASKLSAKVNATVDVTRPEVSSLAVHTDQYGNYTADSASKLDIKFSKAISASQFGGANAENLVVKNAKGEVVAVAASAVLKANHTNTLTVTLSNALTEGQSYSVEVKNVVDGTALNNKMIPQTFTIAVPEITAPAVKNVAVVDAGAEGTKIQVVFSNAMSLDGEYSILKSDRYMIQVGGSWYMLPAGSTFQPTYDSKAVIITIPKDAKYDGTTVLTAAAITGFKTTLVADRNGNKLAGLTKELNSSSPEWGAIDAAIVADKTIATATNKVQLVYDRPLQVVYADDFLVNGVRPTSTSYETVDGQGVVTLTLPTNTLTPNVTATLTTVASTKSLDLLGNKIPAGSSEVVQDGVAPKLVVSTGNTGINAIDGDTIELKFDEALSSTFDAAPANKAALAGMFTVKVGLNQSKTLVAGTDYVADIKDTDATVVEIDFLTPLTAIEKQKITVASNDAAMYIFDLNAFTLTNGYTKANKIKFGTTTVGNTGRLDVAAAQAAAAAAPVIAQINALPAAASLTYADKATVDAARAAYTALTTEQKALVTNLATLTAAEAQVVVLGKAYASGLTVAAQTINVGGAVTLPASLTVTALDGTTELVSIVWSAVDNTIAGTVTATGTVTAGTVVTGVPATFTTTITVQ